MCVCVCVCVCVSVCAGVCVCVCVCVGERSQVMKWCSQLTYPSPQAQRPESGTSSQSQSASTDYGAKEKLLATRHLVCDEEGSASVRN